MKFFLLAKKTSPLLSPGSVILSTPGFTLLEVLVSVVIIGILTAIMAPGWAAFFNTLRLDSEIDEVFQGIRTAQSEAIRTHQVRQFSIREQNGAVQWATHAATVSPISANWNTLDAAVQLDPETSLQVAGGVQRIQFDMDGTVNGQLGRVTLRTKASARPQRCVIVSTLLGAVRVSKSQVTPQNGRFCY